MKFRLAFVFWGAMTAGAHAASIVVLEPRTDKPGPSMIVLGSPAPAAPNEMIVAAAATPTTDYQVPLAFPLPGEDRASGPVMLAAPPEAGQPDYGVPQPRTVSASIIAFGEPPVSSEKLASIGNDSDKVSRPLSMPMVIRGGLVGDAFARPAEATPVVPVKAEAGAPTGKPAQRRDAPSRRDTPSAPQPPATQPPEPPTRKPE